MRRPRESSAVTSQTEPSPRVWARPQPLPGGCPRRLQQPPACGKVVSQCPGKGSVQSCSSRWRSLRGPLRGWHSAACLCRDPASGVIPPGLGGATTEPGVARGAVTSDWNSSAQTTPVSSQEASGQLCTGDPFAWRSQLQDTVRVLGSAGRFRSLASFLSGSLRFPCCS